MTDNQSNIAGDYKGAGNEIVCILDEGAITVSEVAFGPEGSMRVCVPSASYVLEEGQEVALSNDVLALYSSTEGMPIVERAVNAEVLVIGKIVGTPSWVVQPATSAAADTLTERLSGKYYRVALVRFNIPGEIVAAQVMCDGTHATVPGDGSTLKANITQMYTAKHRGVYFDSVASGGTGVIPLHYVPAGTDGDLHTCLCLITGLLTALTGA
jgi:hypothetical protein